MIPLPKNKETVLSTMGLDPGTERLGCGVIYFDSQDFEIVGAQGHTFVGSKLPGNEWVGGLFGHRQQRLDALQKLLTDFMVQVNPVAVGCEMAFFNVRRPSAYGPLMESVCSLRQAVRNFDHWKDLTLVDPPTVKLAVGAKSQKGKEPMREAIESIHAITDHCVPKIDELDEHAIDAIAVAYYMYLRLRDNYKRN